MTYGTLEEPLSVDEALAKAKELINDVEGEFSDGVFFVKGLVSSMVSYTSKSSYFFKVNIADSLSSESYLSVFKATKRENSIPDILYTGDEVIISGYAEYYNDRYTLYPADESPEVLKYTAGTGKISVNTGEFSVKDLKETYSNGETASFSVTPNDDYKVYSVSSNGTLLYPEDGVYSFTVDGDTSIEIKVVKSDFVEDNLEKGTYNVRISKSNSSLPVGSSKSARIIPMNIVEDTDTKSYKKLTASYTAGCFNSPMYEEIEFAYGKGVCLSIDNPNTTITKITVDFYNTDNLAVYANNEPTSDKEVKGVDGTSTSNYNSVVKTYEINNSSAYLKNPSTSSTTFSQMYTIDIEIVVA